jgi:hypothetical protein
MKRRLWLQNDEQNDGIIYDAFTINWSREVWCASAIEAGFRIVGVGLGAIGIWKQEKKGNVLKR